MVICAVCGHAFDPNNKSERRASISGSILGDECIETWYYCESCGVYNKEVYFDMFSGEEKSSTHGPYTKEEGEGKIKLIRQCKEPWSKNCRCAAHLEYFDGSLN